ncbi:MAG TPA: hypothetical protein DIW47_03315 [Bacteroidetes bacterium]|nr:hypothetical protein [Bacteroidota bacterium]
MQKDKPTIQSLIRGGLLGALFGAVLSKNKDEGAIIGALLGAAVAATSEASKEALNTAVSRYVIEDGYLVEINTTGEKRIIRKIGKHAVPISGPIYLK